MFISAASSVDSVADLARLGRRLFPWCITAISSWSRMRAMWSMFILGSILWDSEKKQGTQYPNARKSLSKASEFVYNSLVVFRR